MLCDSFILSIHKYFIYLRWYIQGYTFRLLELYNPMISHYPCVKKPPVIQVLVALNPSNHYNKLINHTSSSSLVSITSSSSDLDNYTIQGRIRCSWVLVMMDLQLAFPGRNMDQSLKRWNLPPTEILICI